MQYWKERYIDIPITKNVILDESEVLTKKQLEEEKKPQKWYNKYIPKPIDKQRRK